MDRVSVLENKLVIAQLRIKEVEKENQKLRSELVFYKSKRNSGNSHLPPSSKIGSSHGVKRKKKKSTRNPGGQTGHKANWLEQTDRPNEMIVHDIVTCGGCGEDLSHQEGEVIRKGQIFDIPRIELHAVEHHKIRKTCPVCSS